MFCVVLIFLVWFFDVCGFRIFFCFQRWFPDVLRGLLFVGYFCEALARRIPFKFGMPSRGPCGDPPRLFVSGVYFLCLF